MKRPAGLLDQFADLVAGLGDAPWMAERMVEVITAVVAGRSGGVFAVSDQRLTLVASRGIDQYVLDAVPLIWARSQDVLRRGQPVYVPDRTADRDLFPTQGAGGPGSLAVFPVLEGESLVALLYVDSAATHMCMPQDLARLSRLSGVLARAVRPPAEARPVAPRDEWETYLERTPVADIEREKLLLLLNRNEWNIARVARLMSVTRRTIYLRLRKYNIPRERVSKTPPRKKPAMA